mgnify:CR=1 FL=1
MSAVTQEATGTLAGFLALLPDGHYALCHHTVGGEFASERVPLRDLESVGDRHARRGCPSHWYPPTGGVGAARPSCAA